MSDFDGGVVPFDDSESVEFDNSPVEDGTYTLMLAGAVVGKSKTNNPKVDWEFKVIDHETYNERRIWHTTPTTGRGAGMFTAVLRAFGYDDVADYLKPFGGVSNEALAGLVGESADARIGTDTPTAETLEKWPNAVPRNKVKRFA